MNTVNVEVMKNGQNLVLQMILNHFTLVSSPEGNVAHREVHFSGKKSPPTMDCWELHKSETWQNEKPSWRPRRIPIGSLPKTTWLMRVKIGAEKAHS